MPQAPVCQAASPAVFGSRPRSHAGLPARPEGALALALHSACTEALLCRALCGHAVTSLLGIAYEHVVRVDEALPHGACLGPGARRRRPRARGGAAQLRRDAAAGRAPHAHHQGRAHRLQVRLPPPRIPLFHPHACAHVATPRKAGRPRLRQMHEMRSKALGISRLRSASSLCWLLQSMRPHPNMRPPPLHACRL